METTYTANQQTALTMTSEALQKWQLELPGIISSTRVTPEGLILRTAPNKLRALALFIRNNLPFFSAVLYFTALLALCFVHGYYLHEAQELADGVQELQRLRDEVLSQDLLPLEKMNAAASIAADAGVTNPAAPKSPDLRLLVVFLAVIAFIYSFGPAGMPIARALIPSSNSPEPEEIPHVTPEPATVVEDEGLNAMFDTTALPFLFDPIFANAGIDPEVTRELFRSANFARKTLILSYMDLTESMKILAYSSTSDCLHVIQRHPEGVANLMTTVNDVLAGMQAHEELRQESAQLLTEPADQALRGLFNAARDANKANLKVFTDNLGGVVEWQKRNR